MINLYKKIIETNLCPICSKTIDNSENINMFYHNCGDVTKYTDTINIDLGGYEITLNENIYIRSDINYGTRVYSIIDNYNFKLLYELDYFYDVSENIVKNLNNFIIKLNKLNIYI